MYYSIGPFQWNTKELAWEGPSDVKSTLDLRNLTQMGSKVQSGYGFFATDTDPGSKYSVLGKGDIREVSSTSLMKSTWNSLLGYSPKGTNLVDLLYDQLTMGADPTGVSGPKPILPSPNLELHLSNHSMIKGTQFRMGHSPETNQVVSTYQHSYREIRDAVIAGKLPADHHRKVLDFWGDKFKIPNPQDIFIPNGLPKETPLKHATLITEDFNGADKALIGYDLTWVEGGDGSNWDNKNNHGNVLNSGDNDDRSCYANSALSGNDQRCTVTNAVQGDATLTQGGPACRRSNSAVTYYMIRVTRLTTFDDTFKVEKVITGTRTLIGSTIILTPVSIPGDSKLEVIGSTLKGFWNDVEKDSFTDTAIASNLFCGLYGGANTPASAAMEFENWSAEDITGFSGSIELSGSFLLGLI